MAAGAEALAQLAEGVPDRGAAPARRCDGARRGRAPRARRAASRSRRPAQRGRARRRTSRRRRSQKPSAAARPGRVEGQDEEAVAAGRDPRRAPPRGRGSSARRPRSARSPCGRRTARARRRCSSRRGRARAGRATSTTAATGSCSSAGDGDAELALGQLGGGEVDEDRLAARARDGPGDGVRAQGAHARCPAGRPRGRRCRARGRRTRRRRSSRRTRRCVRSGRRDRRRRRRRRGVRARRTAVSVASRAASWPQPRLPSTRAMAPRSKTTTGSAPGMHLAALDELDILRQAQHAMRVMSRDVGLDERARDHLRALRRRCRSRRESPSRGRRDQLPGGGDRQTPEQALNG